MNKKISELNEATVLFDNDVLAIVQQGETKKIKTKLFCECGSADLSILDVRPGIYAGEVVLVDQSIPDNLPEFKQVYVSEDDKFLFKKNSVISIHPQVVVYLSDPDQYFRLVLQIYDEEFRLMHNYSVESPTGSGVEQPFTLEIPVYPLTLNKSIYYIKTELLYLTFKAKGGDHTCYTVDAGGLLLTSAASLEGVLYSWTVPPGTEEFFSDTNVQNLAIPFAFIVGDFAVTITDPSTGFQKSKTVMVNDNTVFPECFLVFRVSNSTLEVPETPGSTYTWTVSNNPAWSVASGLGTNTITVAPGPVGSSALYTVSVQIVSTGCREDCSLMLHRTSTGIVATVNNNIP